MARYRKNVKRIDPRYFLHETATRGEDLEENCPHEEGGEALDISGPGAEVHVDDISELSSEEAFAAGMAAARDAIDQAMGAPDGPPPEGGFSGGGPAAEPAMQETALEETSLQQGAGLSYNLRDPKTLIADVERLLAAGEITSENGETINDQLNNALGKSQDAEDIARLKGLKQELLKIGATTLGASARERSQSAWRKGVRMGTRSLAEPPPGE